MSPLNFTPLPPPTLPAMISFRPCCSPRLFVSILVQVRHQPISHLPVWLLLNCSLSPCSSAPLFSSAHSCPTRSLGHCSVTHDASVAMRPHQRVWQTHSEGESPLLVFSGAAARVEQEVTTLVSLLVAQRFECLVTEAVMVVLGYHPHMAWLSFVDDLLQTRGQARCGDP